MSEKQFTPPFSVDADFYDAKGNLLEWIEEWGACPDASEVRYTVVDVADRTLSTHKTREKAVEAARRANAGRRPTKYDVGKEFSAGFSAALLPQSRSLSESDHWLAGWDAGYAFRKAKNEKLNEYLVAAGYEPMGTIVLAAARQRADQAGEESDG